MKVEGGVCSVHFYPCALQIRMKTVIIPKNFEVSFYLKNDCSQLLLYR